MLWNLILLLSSRYTLKYNYNYNYGAVTVCQKLAEEREREIRMGH